VRFGGAIVRYARRGAVLGLLAVITALAGVASAGAAARPSQVRVGRPPRHPARSRVVGALPGSTGVQLNVTLQPRDAAGLAAYATAVSAPGSSLYHHYLSVGQFRRKFGPSADEVAAVRASLRAHGLNPGTVSANGLSIPVSASAAAVGQAFALSFQRVALPSGRTAFANAQAPQFDSAVAADVQGVVGLDSLSVPTAQAIVRPRSGAAPRAAASPSPNVVTGGPQPCSTAVTKARQHLAYTADQLASAYQLSSLYGAGDQGAGQTIALFELEPNSASDVAAYQSCYGTSASVGYVQVDGGAGSGTGAGEAALDIEDVIGLAPQANVLVYQGPNSGSGAYDTYAAIIGQDRAQVISTSWGLCEPDEQGTATAQAENTLFQEAAAQGQSVFAAAGDDGSEDCGSGSAAVDDPASQPYVTGVGGTQLSTVGPPATESVWNESTFSAGAGGGGISSAWPMPSYQSGAPQALGVINGSSSGSQCGAASGGYCREVPDVSADADPYTGYLIYWNGSWSGIGGTSAAAPLWAAFMALVNASSACHGSAVGFANPALYAAAASNYSSDFSDIVVGNNDYSGASQGAFAAATGFDMASGLGTPLGSALPADLCSHTGSGGSSVTVTNPGPQLTTVGSAVSLQIAASDSSSGETLSYTATGLPPGLSIDPASGLITGVASATGSATTDVTVSDGAGASRSVSFTWTVTSRATALVVSCAPSSLATGASTSCTATVSDTSGGTPAAPVGTVTFAGSSYGTFPGGNVCTLGPAGVGTARCAVTYAPGSAGTVWLTATYGGDVVHGANASNALLSVSAPASSPHPPSSVAPTVPSARITGSPELGSVLTCPASSAAHPSYLWTRNGTPIVGADSRQYRVQAIDEGTTLTCVVTVATAASAVRPPAISASVIVPVPAVSGCPAAAGGASATSIGLVRLGMARAQARRAYAGSRDRASRSHDTFCLTPIGLQVGYVRGRVAWIATGNASYAIHGIRAGAALIDAAERVKLGKAMSLGRNRWYLAPAGAVTVLVEVRGGVVQEIGVASNRLTRTRAARQSLVRVLQQSS
jgi:hypothetical protein